MLNNSILTTALTTGLSAGTTQLALSSASTMGPNGRCEFTIGDNIDAVIEYKTDLNIFRKNLHVTIDMDFTLRD